MEESKKDFFSLIAEVMQLEVKHETSQEEFKHLQYLHYSFGKNNIHKMNIAKYESDTLKEEMDKLLKQVTELQLDAIMQSYYDLYKEKSELLKKSWELQTQIAYIDSSFIFDAVCDDEIEDETAKKQDNLKMQKEFLDNQIVEIDLKMKAIHPA